jgi:hypothetical protein
VGEEDGEGGLGDAFAFEADFGGGADAAWAAVLAGAVRGHGVGGFEQVRVGGEELGGEADAALHAVCLQPRSRSRPAGRQRVKAGQRGLGPIARRGPLGRRVKRATWARLLKNLARRQPTRRGNARLPGPLDPRIHSVAAQLE